MQALTGRAKVHLENFESYRSKVNQRRPPLLFAQWLIIYSAQHHGELNRLKQKKKKS